MTVSYNAGFFEQSDDLLASAPCWRCPAAGLLARDVCEYLYAFFQHVSLLLLTQCRHELVGVAVQPNLVTCIDDFANLLGERLGRVRWCEPSLIRVRTKAVDKHDGGQVIVVKMLSWSNENVSARRRA